jgi:hypothetical protein
VSPEEARAGLAGDQAGEFGEAFVVEVAEGEGGLGRGWGGGEGGSGGEQEEQRPGGRIKPNNCHRLPRLTHKSSVDAVIKPHFQQKLLQSGVCRDETSFGDAARAGVAADVGETRPICIQISCRKLRGARLRHVDEVR